MLTGQALRLGGILRTDSLDDRLVFLVVTLAVVVQRADLLLLADTNLQQGRQNLL